MNRETILIEDKYFSTNTIPKGVLKASENVLQTKSRVYKTLDEVDDDDLHINENLMRFVTDGLKFDVEVVKSKCAHALPYDQTTLNEYFKNKNLLSNDILINQHKLKTKPLRKWPENKKTNHELVPLISCRDTSKPKFKPKDVFITEKTKILPPIQLDEKKDTFFITQENSLDTEKGIQEVKESTSEIRKTTDWDDYVISQLSENTARWIVAKQTKSSQKQKLSELLEIKFGKSNVNEEDLQLFEDSSSESDNETSQVSNVANYKEKEDSDNTKNDESSVPTYRLPQGIRRLIKKKEKDMTLNKNQTALSIEVEHKRVLSAKTFQEKMTHKLNSEKTVFLTENEYQVEMVSGNVSHVHSDDTSKISLNNGKSFVKLIQHVFPQSFYDWINKKPAKVNTRHKRPTKGKKRWTHLPEIINTDVMNAPRTDDTIFWHLLPTTPDASLKKLVKSNSTVAYIVQEWRRRWQVGSRWACADVDDLLKDLKDIHANIRFQALVVCARAAEYATLSESKESSILDSNEAHEALPPSIFDAIEDLLDDTNERVKLAAAITLFTVQRNGNFEVAKEKAEFILRQTLESSTKDDRYAAAQCLASHNICEYKIILILLQNYFSSSDQVTREQMVKLLSNLSRRSYLIVSMTGEYLNSEDERLKILACKLLPSLQRSLNKDLADKLIYLMWDDSNRNVRKVAAQTLGKTGKSQKVHDELLNRLKSEAVNDRIEALKKIHYLGIMTTKLLPAYLTCFKDDYILVRELACKSSQKLQLKDVKILATLLELAQFDQIPKIKACAIQSLGLVSDFNQQVKKCLLWAMRYEIDPLVRAEACHSLILLTKDDNEVIEAFQERYLVESELLVKEELKEALSIFGRDPNQDMPMVAQIKNEVRKLNSKEIIWSKIKELETKLDFEYNKKRFIGDESLPMPDTKQEIHLVETKKKTKIKVAKKHQKPKQEAESENNGFLSRLVNDVEHENSKMNSIEETTPSSDSYQTQTKSKHSTQNSRDNFIDTIYEESQETF